jgi:hypothetical protein
MFREFAEELVKIASILDVSTPEGADTLKRFASRKDVYGHRTNNADAVLSAGAIAPALKTLGRGSLKSYEAGIGAGHSSVTVNPLSKEHLDRIQSSLLKSSPDHSVVKDVARETGMSRDDVMKGFLGTRQSSIRRFLGSEVSDPEEFRRKNLSVSKLSPHVFVTKGGILDAPKYGDVSILVRSRSAAPSPFTNFISSEHVVSPVKPLKFRDVKVRSGIVIAPRERVDELQGKYPDYKYVVEEDIPDDVKKDVFLPNRDIREIKRRWIPSLLGGNISLRPR